VLEARLPAHELMPVARRAGRDPLLVARLAWAMRRARPDVVHTHNDSPLVYGVPAARLAGVRRVIHTKHGAKAPARNLALRSLLTRGLDAYVAVSVETAERARTIEGVPKDKLVTIPNGIPTKEFSPDPVARAEVRAALGIDPNAFVVGTLGRLVLEKRPDVLLRAMAPLLSKGAHLVYGGDGPERARLEATVARDKLPNVHLLGARRDTARVLAALDVFALSSALEGLPLALVEAMATALPVVATDVGGIREATQDAARLVPPGDEEALRSAILELWISPPLRSSLGALACERARAHFDFDRVVNQDVSLYEGLT
jgi:glycosyltransferase involved in cell wall biosynthesis